MRKLYLLLFGVVLATLAVYAAGTAKAPSAALESEENPAFHAQVAATYTFAPHTLTSEQINEKSKLLDAFWKETQQANPSRLPFLRHELALDKQNPFFYFDGAKLLLELSKAPEDGRLALASFAQSDLRDLSLGDYVTSVNALTRQGLDGSKAAFHILDLHDFKAVIPQHSLTLDHGLALLFMLLPGDEALYEEQALALLKSQKDASRQKALLRLLWYIDSPKSTAAIAWAAQESSLPEETRQDAALYLDDAKKFKAEPELAKKLAAQLPAGLSGNSSREELLEARKKAMGRISDEALYELRAITGLLKQKNTP